MATSVSEPGSGHLSRWCSWGLWGPMADMSGPLTNPPSLIDAGPVFDMSAAHGIGLDRTPHDRAGSTSSWTLERIGHNHPVDHVGEHRNPWPTLDTHRHGDCRNPKGIDLTPHCAINTRQTRWAPESGDN